MKKNYFPPSAEIAEGKEGAGEIAQASGVIAVIAMALALNLLLPTP